MRYLGLEWLHLDLDFINYALGEIEKNINKPYIMANEELADELFPEVKKIYSNAKMVKLGIGQYITVSKKAEKDIIKRLKAERENHEKKIKEIDYCICSISLEGMMK